MAVQWASDTMQRAGDVWAEFPENIVIVPELNGRHENTDVESLAADIEANGQNEPCGFRKGDDGSTVLAYGHRRYRAVMLINKWRAARGEERRKLLGIYLRVDDKQAFIRAISENRQRRDVSPVDDAHNIGTLIERFQYSLEDVAKVYFPEAKKPEEFAEALRFVKQRHALLELAPEAEKAVRDGRVKLTAAVHLAKLSRDAQRKVVASQPEGRIKVKAVSPAAAKASSKSAPSQTEAAPKDVLKIAKKLVKEITLKELEDSNLPYFEVPRAVLIDLYKTVNPS